MGNAGQANYSAAKAGVTGLTKTIAKEWGQFKVNCNAIAFGFVETRLTASKDEGGEIEREGEKIELGIPDQAREMAKFIIPLGRPAQPEEAAGPVLHALLGLRELHPRPGHQRDRRSVHGDVQLGTRRDPPLRVRPAGPVTAEHWRVLLDDRLGALPPGGRSARRCPRGAIAPPIAMKIVSVESAKA